MTIYRPGMVAILTVPLIGTREQRIEQAASTEAIDLVVLPKSAHVELNDHNHADSCTIVADWLQVGVDARMLDNAVLQVFIDNGDDFGNWVPSEKNCRFIGLTNDVTSDRTSDSAAQVTIEALDYTTLFLKAKPFSSSGIPHCDQTLEEAWQTIVNGLRPKLLDASGEWDGRSFGPSPAAVLRLELQGLDSFPVIGKAVSDRFRKLAKVPTHPETDAWAVWQQCVGMCGLISYIKLDRCIITTATNYYTEGDSPVLMWGRNIEEWGEVRHSGLSRNGVGLTSYDPLTQTTLEAFYPPIGDARIKAKRVGAKRVLGQEAIRQSETRDWFAYPSIQSQEALDAQCRRVWEERSRQELEGHVKTPYMSTETESGADFDLLSLSAGDSVKVLVDPQNRQLLAALPSDEERIRYLKRRGYSEDACRLIVANMKDFASLEAKFIVKSAEIQFELTDDGGSFSVEFEYINRIQIDGSATA